MRLTDIDRRIRPTKLPAREVPHATIEPNKTCNIRCAACYSLDRTVVKPLAQVQQEIDRALERRNLETISLLGGEPTLHPRLEEIVRHVKRRGLICMVLTNGVTLLREPRRIDRLQAAGVDRFILHLDQGQEHVHGDVDRARHELCRSMEARRAWFALSLTVQAGTERRLPALMREYGRYRFFDGVLTTLALDFEGLFTGAEASYEPADLGQVHRGLTEDLGVRPAAAIPTNVDDDEVGWLMYFYYLNVETGRTFSMSPSFSRGLRRVWRALSGRQFFAATMDPRWFLPSLVLTAVIELLVAPRRLGALGRLLVRSARGRHLRFQYVVVQVPPHLDEQGRLHLCHRCPDAVLRNGRLAPVCIADQLDPLGAVPARAPGEVLRQVRAHLGEPQDEPLRRTG